MWTKGRPVQTEAERMLWEKFHLGQKLMEQPELNLSLHCAEYTEKKKKRCSEEKNNIAMKYNTENYA